MALKETLRLLGRGALNFGIDPRKLVRATKGLPPYVKSAIEFRKSFGLMEPGFGKITWFPCLGEKGSDSGSARGHYFHQDLLVARRIFENKPEKHVDVGSRIDGFVAHVACFRKIEVMDIRQLHSNIPNVAFLQADMQGSLRSSLLSYADSLSCLHALEHFGLGRYGDPVDAGGHLKGLDNIVQILRPKGRFYLSVPIGPQRVEFNAHRVFSVSYMMNLLLRDFDIEAISYVDDAGDLHESVSYAQLDVLNSFGCHYGCGIFECVRRG